MYIVLILSILRNIFRISRHSYVLVTLFTSLSTVCSSTHRCVCQWNEVIISRNTILFGSTLWESDNRDKGGVILDGNRDFQRRPETPFNFQRCFCFFLQVELTITVYIYILTDRSWIDPVRHNHN